MEYINPPKVIVPYNRVKEEYRLLRVLGEVCISQLSSIPSSCGDTFEKIES